MMEDDPLVRMRAALIAQELLEAVTASGTRHVRTPAGAKLYGQPIGSVITKDVVSAARLRQATRLISGTTGKARVRTKKGKEPGEQTMRVRTPAAARTTGQPIGSTVQKSNIPAGALGRASGLISARMEARIHARQKGIVPAAKPSALPTAYPNAERTADGRVILRPDQLADFDPKHGPHSMMAFVEDAFDKNGKPVKVLSKEREALHDKMVQQALRGVKPNPSGKRTFTYIGGGPGSGKSTVTKILEGFPKVREFMDVNGEPGEAVLVDGDAIKLSLPEWGKPDKMRAAGFTHEESSLIAKATADAAIARDLDVVLDGTGDGAAAKMLSKIKKAEANGYAVNGLYITVPASEALVRSLERSISSGRYMPIKPLMDIHRDVISTVKGVRFKYDKFDLWDTDIPLGEMPHQVVHNGKTIDAARYAAFLNKVNVTNLQAARDALPRAEARTYKEITAPDTGRVWSPAEVKANVIESIRELIAQYEANERQS